MHDKQDWRGLAQNVIRIGYEFDLSYYYLAVAAKGLGLQDSSKIYYKKALDLSESLDSTCIKAKLNKCNGIDIASNANEALK